MSNGSSEEPIATAHEVASLVRNGRDFAETNRRLDPAVVAALRDANLFLLNAPTECGGVEATPRQIYDIVEIIARADPSAAWYLTNSTPACHLGAWVSEELRQEVYTSNRGNFGFSGAPGGRLVAVDGGFRLNGSWPLVTGVSDARFSLLVAILEHPTESGSPARMCLVERSQLDVNEVWTNAAAMRGTGSHEVSIHDRFIPDGLAINLAARPILDRPRFAHLNLAHIGGIANAAVPIGILQDALDAAIGELHGKVSALTGVATNDAHGVLELVAHTHSALLSLRAGAQHLADGLGEAVLKGERASLQLRADAATYQFYAANTARRLISDLYGRSSRASFFEGHPLEQAMRNSHAVAYGVESLRTMQHDAGRVTLGIDPPAPRF